jgi:hypothetical protein
MSKDKYKYIEKLLKRYRENKAEIELISVMSIDYSGIKVQTSNMSTLDDIIIKLDKLKKEIATIDALIKCLSIKDKFIIESFYKEGQKLMWIGNHPNVRIDTENGVGIAKKEAIKKMATIYSKNAKYFNDVKC